MTSVYVKNSKGDFPLHVKSLITSLSDRISDAVIGRLFWRETQTCRQQHGFGVNMWTLFTLALADPREFRVTAGDDSDGERPLSLPCGRRDGRGLGFHIERILSPAIVLPNGSTLPAETSLLPAADVLFTSIVPSPMEAEEAWAALPFHQPGGPDSRLEPMPDDWFEREIVSCWAHNCPAEFRQTLREHEGIMLNPSAVAAALAWRDALLVEAATTD